MMDFLKEHQNIISVNEGIFDRLFGRKTPPPPAGTSFGGVLQRLPSGEWELAGNSVKKLLGATDEQLDEIDWYGGPFSFLAQSTFEANKIVFGWSAQQVFLFDGAWKKGDFKGDKFQGVFEGGTFEGGFEENYDKWRAHPGAFIGGTHSGAQYGLLGMKKINPSFFDASSVDKKVCILQVPIGYHVNITDAYKNVLSFKVEKLIDDVSSDLIFEEGGNRVVVSWEQMRGSAGAFFSPSVVNRNIFIEVGRKLNIPGLFEGQPMGKIVSFEVSPQPAKTQAVGAQKTKTLDLSFLKPLRFAAPGGGAPMVKLFFPSSMEAAEYQKMESELSAGLFEYHLKTIAKGLANGAIKSANGYPFMQKLLPSLGNVKTWAEGMREKDKQSMAWMDSFIDNVIYNMVKNRAVGGISEPNVKTQNLVMQQMKDYLQKNIAITTPTSVGRAKPIV